MDPGFRRESDERNPGNDCMTASNGGTLEPAPGLNRGERRTAGLGPRLRGADGEAFRSGRAMLSIGQARSRGRSHIARGSPVLPVLSGRDQGISRTFQTAKPARLASTGDGRDPMMPLWQFYSRGFPQGT